MRAANTLSPAETDRLLDVTVVSVRYLETAALSYASVMIPIITIAVTVLQMVLVSSCLKQVDYLVNLILLQ
jgi:hypothetical protein